MIARVQRNVRIPGLGWLRELRPHVVVRNFVDFSGFTETRYLHIDHAIAFNDGAYLSTAVNLRREGLQAPFEIAQGVEVPADTYDFAEMVLRFNTNESAAWSVNGVVTLGNFFSGRRRSVEATLTNRFGSAWSADLRVSHDVVDLAEGSFRTSLVGLRAAYAFTPRIFLQALIQYSGQSETFSGNVRFGWLSTAGTGLFLVLNEVRQTVTPKGPRERAFIVKFTRQFTLTR